jgi:putative ATPase
VSEFFIHLNIGEYWRMSNLSPLANQLRPSTLLEFIGQNKVVGANSIISFCLKSRRLNNLILWGPPGTGKTSLALLLGNEFDAEFVSLNAVEIGTKILRELGDRARLKFRLDGRQTLVFVDEIHRLNKSQQDVLLPFIEQGDFVLIGATTENPSYELNRALLSRCHLLVFEALKREDLLGVWQRACILLNRVTPWISDEGLDLILELGDGDARRFINLIEILAVFAEQAPHYLPLGIDKVRMVLPKQLLAYDKSSDFHYDLTSALIKSLRGSDPDAGLYYLARMIESGEDPVFIARRLVIFSSEDIGNADPRALQIAIAGAEAVQFVGLPECGINLAQVVTYLACSPKSNRSYKGWLSAKEFVEKTKSVPIPLHLRSSRTEGMKKLGYGMNYKYPHDWPRAWVEQNYFPEGVERAKFYEPSEVGFEKTIKAYQQWAKGKNTDDGSR